MRPMRRFEAELLALRDQHQNRLELRVSLDHHIASVHEAERGPGTWEVALSGLGWLAREGFSFAVAGRHLAGETDADARRGYATLFAGLGIKLDVDDPMRLVLFPEMDATADVPEVTEACWALVGKSPDAMMCATSRMVVRRRGEASPPSWRVRWCRTTRASTWTGPIGGHGLGRPQPSELFALLRARRGDVRLGRPCPTQLSSMPSVHAAHRFCSSAPAFCGVLHRCPSAR